MIEHIYTHYTMESSYKLIRKIQQWGTRRQPELAVHKIRNKNNHGFPLPVRDIESQKRPLFSP